VDFGSLLNAKSIFLSLIVDFFVILQPNYIELEAGNIYGGDLHNERRTDFRAVFKLLLPVYGTDTEK
jgi:hypothetical protein